MFSFSVFSSIFSVILSTSKRNELISSFFNSSLNVRYSLAFSDWILRGSTLSSRPERISFTRLRFTCSASRFFSVISLFFLYLTIPAASSKSEGFCEELRDYFNQTETVSLIHETLLKPERLMNASSNDCYIISQFGLMDAILDEKLGITPKREEGELMLMSK